jgi:hypothetical protein
MKLSPEDSAWRTAAGEAMREAVELRKQLRAQGNPVVSASIRDIEKIVRESARATQRLIEGKLRQLQQGPPTPEYIRLPVRGHDPFFGLSRSMWYELENRGVIRMVRIRKPGRVRGIVLIPYEQGREAVRKLAQ